MASFTADGIESFNLTETSVISLSPRFRNGAYVRCPTSNTGTVYFGSAASGVPVPESDDWSDAVLITADFFNTGGLVVTPSAATQVIYLFPG